MNVQAPNPFLRFWSLGYRRLVPIVPPGANISPKSALAKRPGSIGKAVGVQRRDGSWSGMDWIPYTASENDLRDWHAMGAGVGLKTGAGIVALDIDTLHQTVGDLVQALASQMLGPAPLRWGREPKRLMLYRAPPDTPYMRVIFDDGLPTKVGKEPRVELLTDQRQAVVHGVHPDTGRPYRWEGLCPLEELTPVTADQLRAFFARLAAELPAARVAVDEAATDRQHVNQEALRGRSDLVVEAVRRLPNTVDLFPTYDDYIRVGAAIKGALQDDPGLAEECFVEWAARFEGDDDFDPARAAADLRRVKPPFALGRLCKLM